jgi:nucleoside-diphosphate-sugar epimerase
VPGTAFILGGSGQIGRAAARRMAGAGWHVTVGARTRPHPDLDLPFVRVDRTVDGELERALGDGVDVLVDVIPFTQRDADQLRALATRVGSLVAISSAAVYTDQEGRDPGDPDARFPLPIGERQPTVPPGDQTYATRKRAVELTLLEDERLRATIIRPGAIHGPGGGKQSREWYFVKRALDGRRAIVLARRGGVVFHTTSVDNLAELIRLTASYPGTRIVNCGDPEPPSALEIARTIAAAMDADWAEVLLAGPERGPVGDHPWNTPHPFVLDMLTAEIDLAYRAVTTYARAVEQTVTWLVDATRERPWEEVVEPTPQYLGLFDYAAEDVFLASLGGRDTPVDE